MLSPYQDFELFLNAEVFCRNLLDIKVVSKILRFKQFSYLDKGYLLIKEHKLIKNVRTPTNIDQIHFADFMSEAILLEISCILGEPISYIQESDKYVINNIFPLQQHAKQISSSSSETELQLHTENAFHKYSPDYVILGCLRQDSQFQAITYLSFIDDILTNLTSNQILCLQKENYNFLSDYTKNAKGAKVDIQMHAPILTGDKNHFYFKFDPDFMRANNDNSQRLLDSVVDEAWRVAIPIKLEAGDILIIDNNITAHARSKFQALYDGNDRWIQRLFVKKDRKNLIETSHFNTRIIRELK